MSKLTTALALVAITAGSLVAVSGTSFAAGRHGKRPGPQKVVAVRKVKRGHKGFQNFDESSLFARRVRARKKYRRHRKIKKNPSNPGTGPISQISMNG